MRELHAFRVQFSRPRERRRRGRYAAWKGRHSCVRGAWERRERGVTVACDTLSLVLVEVLLLVGVVTLDSV